MDASQDPPQGQGCSDPEFEQFIHARLQGRTADFRLRIEVARIAHDPQYWSPLVFEVGRLKPDVREEVFRLVAYYVSGRALLQGDDPLPTADEWLNMADARIHGDIRTSYRAALESEAEAYEAAKDAVSHFKSLIRDGRDPWTDPSSSMPRTSDRRAAEVTKMLLEEHSYSVGICNDATKPGTCESQINVSRPERGRTR